MEHIILFVLQATDGADPWSIILGPLGALAISVFGNIHQARELRAERNENKKIAEVMRMDSKESMQILASMDKMLEKMIGQLGDGETRIKQTVKDSAENVKEHVDTLMTNIGTRHGK